jgi:hypothetical protein
VYMCFTGRNGVYMSVTALNLIPSGRKVKDYLPGVV